MKADILNKLKNILASEKISSMKTRIHGDYHLGQVLIYREGLHHHRF